MKKYFFSVKYPFNTQDGHVLFSVGGSGARPRDTFAVDIAYARREESTGLNTRYCGLLL